jgi:hypothetical protein
MSRVAGLRRVIGRDPNYTVITKIKTAHGVVSDVPCRIYLPRTVMGRPYLEFDLSETQRGPLTVPEFSVQGDAETTNGFMSVRSDIVFTQGWTEERRGSNFIKCTLPGEPWNLEIHISHSIGVNDNLMHSGLFWLTPNRFLNPSLIVVSSHTGDVKVETAREVSFQLPTTAVRFRRYFSDDRRKDGTLSTSELVAEFNDSIDRARLSSIVEELDDLLLLTSLATRHRCVCRKWSIHTENSEMSFYRSQIAAPKIRRIEMQETLIDDPQFAEFLKHSYPLFREHAGREALRQAIDLLVSAQQGEIESSFLKSFAALETLVTYHRGDNRLTTILDPEQWKSFNEDLKNFIKQHSLFNADVDRRKLIYEKRSELNRVAFGTAYRRCTESLSNSGFHADDLWPVVGSSRGLSLSEIRNRIVHGMVFTPVQQEGLLVARVHLGWHVERMLLAFLDWPLERSLVGRFLNNIVPYRSWKEAQKALDTV